MKGTVTVGVPTFNRPDQLRNALASIARQTRHPDIVIVSDNARNGAAEVVAEFNGVIEGLRYVSQPTNLGGTGNFLWLLSEATTDYFMWLADDDELGASAIEAMASRLDNDRAIRMVFPDVDAYFDASRTSWLRSIHRKPYGAAKSDMEYLEAWAAYGGGHAFYGLYRREWLVTMNPRALLDSHLAYFGEGRYLHTLFLEGGLRFEPAATLVYDGRAAMNIPTPVLLRAFTAYMFSIHRLYITTPKLTVVQKLRMLRILGGIQYPYFARLIKGTLGTWVRYRRR